MVHWFDTDHNPTFRTMQRVIELTTLCGTNVQLMQMFGSIAGLGKSETVAQVLTKLELDYVYGNPNTVPGFCDLLWKAKNRGLLIDDSEGLVKNPALLGIAKMWYGATGVCVCPNNRIYSDNESYRTSDVPAKRAKYNKRIPPPTFSRGPLHFMLALTNHDYSDPLNVPAACRVDFAALDSRGLDPLWIPTEPQDLYYYTIGMVMTGMLKRHQCWASQGQVVSISKSARACWISSSTTAVA